MAKKEPIQVVPFLKWAGGKRWLLSSNPELFPQNVDRYIEPFLGSGAVFFALRPKKAILADINSDLINCFGQIRDSWKKVELALRRHSRFHDVKYYYLERDRKRRAPHERAAQFLYLNRTCWNGLYRVNLQGKFNVPKGTKNNVLLDTDDFRAAADILSNAKIACQDFEKTIGLANKGDFVFVDPPYTVQHNFNGFVKYNEKIFCWEDQVRLRDCILSAWERGAEILLLNADHGSIKDLYCKFDRLFSIPRASVIAGDSAFRKRTTELCIHFEGKR